MRTFTKAIATCLLAAVTAMAANAATTVKKPTVKRPTINLSGKIPRGLTSVGGGSLKFGFMGMGTFVPASQSVDGAQYWDVTGFAADDANHIPYLWARGFLQVDAYDERINFPYNKDYNFAGQADYTNGDGVWDTTVLTLGSGRLAPKNTFGFAYFSYLPADAWNNATWVFVQATGSGSYVSCEQVDLPKPKFMCFAATPISVNTGEWVWIHH